MTAPVIGYAGMTHLGLVSAVAAAEKGFEVVCFDPDEARIGPLARGELPVVEPGLPDLVAKNQTRLAFTADVGSLSRCDVVYVAPDVPTDDSGKSDLSSVAALVEIANTTCRREAVLVILSQVPPGFTRRLRADRPHLYYQVETLIFGRAVERALRPERFIVGSEHPEAPLAAPLRAFLESFGCPILPMRYESAELAKISINCCLVASVGVANTLAELCEAIGADWAEIVPALKLDQRIGPFAYLAPGLGIAGGNLERDLATVCHLADAHGTDAGVVRAWTRNSEHRRQWVLRTLHRELPAVAGREPIIGILGLAYKQDTHSTKNSPSLALIRHLASFTLRVYDPVVSADVVQHPAATGARDPLDACRGADAVCVMTPWKHFAALDPREIASTMRGRLIVDPYAVLDARRCASAGLRYICLGVPPRQPEG